MFLTHYPKFQPQSYAKDRHAISMRVRRHNRQVRIGRQKSKV